MEKKTIAENILDVKFTINHAKNKYLPDKDIIKYSNRYITEIDEKIKFEVSSGATRVCHKMPKSLDIPQLDENKREIVSRAVYVKIVEKFRSAGFDVKYTASGNNQVILEFSGWAPKDIFTDSKKFMEYINK